VMVSGANRLRFLNLASAAKLIAFFHSFRPVRCRSIIPWSACAAPGLSTQPSPGA
jgi:hypothetical protein